jgi:hypothetical protein
MRRVFLRPVSPRTMVTAERGILRILANTRTTASLALPSTGGAFTATHSRSPWIGPTPSRDERGFTAISTVTAPSFSFIRSTETAFSHTCRSLSARTLPALAYFVSAKVSVSVRTTLPAVALIMIGADPTIVEELFANFRTVMPLPGAASLLGAKVADTPEGSPWTTKVTAELNPPSIVEVRFTKSVSPARCSVNAELFELNVRPGTSSVKVVVLVTPPPVAVMVSG